MKNLGLTYCTNVHPISDWAAWRDLIGRFGPAVRADLGWAHLPMGLWFPAALARDLDGDADGGRMRLQNILKPPALGAFTCNAFPYGYFHDPVVKTKVYHPDWTLPERLEYTVTCARLLANLLPEGGEGSVSTLPLGWRIGWSAEHSRKAAEALCDYAAAARALADGKNRVLRLGLEPEPGCVLETIDQVLAFWDQTLRPVARARGMADAELDAFVGLCYDTCHQAVQFEDPIQSLDRLAAAGIPIVKMQLSSALEFRPDPGQVTRALRQSFVEPRFLHQTRAKAPAAVLAFDDLPDALASDHQDLWSQPWRVHYHVPIHAAALSPDASAPGFPAAASGVPAPGPDALIATTQADMLAALRHALARGLCRHFEVETYTWSVLPPALRPKDDAALAHSIAEEIRFVVAQTPGGTFPDA